jgi:hypothetical protein
MYIRSMKKQFLFLMMVSCLSLSSVSADASPPKHIGIHESKIKQSLADFKPVSRMAITSYAYDCAAVLAEDYCFTDAKPQPMVQLVCPTSPIKSVDGLGVLSYDGATNMSRIPDLGFHYIRGACTHNWC